MLHFLPQRCSIPVAESVSVLASLTSTSVAAQSQTTSPRYVSRIAQEEGECAKTVVRLMAGARPIRMPEASSRRQDG
ncbi:MAG TPA: hypothetical protein VFR08_00255 [Candidatus Angelobacter sp.]|nr:hypothetical protein [Candidatus Angelobacter sp.]